MLPELEESWRKEKCDEDNGEQTRRNSLGKSLRLGYEMVLYAGHGDTIVALLNQLNITMERYPQNLATVHIEIHGPKDPSVVPSPDNHYVRVLYYDE